MKFSINIILDKELDNPKYIFSTTVNTNVDFQLDIYTNGSETYEELLANREDIDKAVKDAKKDLEMFDIECNVNDSSDINESTISYIRFDTGSYYNDVVNFGEFMGPQISEEDEIELIYQYLLKHEEFRNRPIVLPDKFDMTTDIEKLKEKYKGFNDIYVNPKEELDPIRITEANVGNDFNTLINKLKQLNMSPLEYAILIYDIVREKPYQYEKENEGASQSRDLYKILSGDAIVCMGYCNIYARIMNELGVKSTVISLDGIQEGHAGHVRMLTHICDPKYNVNGIFISDPTYDARDDKDNDNDYLYSYKFFLKKFHFFSQFDKVDGLVNKTLRFFDRSSDFNKLVNDTTIDFMSSFSLDKLEERTAARIALKNLIWFLDELEEEQALTIQGERYKKQIKKLWNAKLEATTFVRALMNVRTIENMIDPDKYPLDYNRIYHNTHKYGFHFDEDKVIKYTTDEEKKLFKVFGLSAKDVAELRSDLSEESKTETIKRNYALMLRNEISTINTNKEKGMYKVVNSINLYKKGNKDVKK